MNRQPLISLITVNYNQSRATCEMIRSVLACGYDNLEILVVDNASPSDCPEIIKDAFPNVIFIKSPKNIGFAGGNNIAIEKAKGEYIYLLNNDTIIPKRNIENLVSVLASDPLIGVVCPKIKFYNNPELIQFAGYTDMSHYTFRNRCIGYGEHDIGQYDKQCESAFAHGAAMMLKRETIEKTGLMNEHYFLYYEELDWSTRIKKQGYKIVYVPNTHVLHKESLSTGKSSPLQTYYLNRNRVLYVRCNVDGLQKIISITYQMLVSMPKNMFVFGSRRQLKHLKAVFRAWVWTIRHIGCSKICVYKHLK